MTEREGRMVGVTHMSCQYNEIDRSQQQQQQQHKHKSYIFTYCIIHGSQMRLCNVHLLCLCASTSDCFVCLSSLFGSFGVPRVSFKERPANHGQQTNKRTNKQTYLPGHIPSSTYSNFESLDMAEFI